MRCAGEKTWLKIQKTRRGRGAAAPIGLTWLLAWLRACGPEAGAAPACVHRARCRCL